MDILEKLIEVCTVFKQGKFNTEEFQKRIETICLPDECKDTLEKIQQNAQNRLEEIKYCYRESQKQHADRVADELIEATLLEQSRLKKG